MLSKSIKITCNIISSAVVLLSIIGITLFLVLPTIFNLRPFVVLSGSMEPLIKTGAVAWIDEAHKEDIQQGEVIAFKLNDSNIVTHRVDSINEENKFVTKGDNNEIADMTLVSQEDVIGRYKFNIPYLGLIIIFIKQSPIVVIPIVMFFGFLFMLDSFLRDDKKDTKEQITSEFNKEH